MAAIYKLVYFNLKARAEPARYMLAIAGIKYEDKRVTDDEWGKMKASSALGQLPLLYVDGKVMPQSGAINRYLARKHDLFGSNPWESASVDVVCDTVDEIWPTLVQLFMESDETKKDKIRKRFVDMELKTWSSKLETLLKQNNNGDGWFVGDKISLADTSVYSALVDFLPGVGKVPEIDISSHEALQGFITRFPVHPKVAEWITNRPKSDM